MPRALYHGTDIECFNGFGYAGYGPSFWMVSCLHPNVYKLLLPRIVFLRLKWYWLKVILFQNWWLWCSWVIVLIHELGCSSENEISHWWVVEIKLYWMATSYALQTVSYIISSFLGQIFVIGNSVRFRRVIQLKPKPECQHTRERKNLTRNHTMSLGHLCFFHMSDMT